MIAVPLHAPVDLYCERLDPSLWAEPLNALSNGAFFAAALWLWWRSRRQDLRDPAVAALIWMVALIGLGSALFHTFATRWAQAADVIPIGAFVLAYLALAARRLFGAPWPLAAGCVGGFAVISGLTAVILPRDLLGGGATYLPVLLVLALMATLLRARRHPAAPWILTGAVAFALSYTARALDGPLCAIWPSGTHWLWHCLNGVVLAALTWGLTRR